MLIKCHYNLKISYTTIVNVGVRVIWAKAYPFAQTGNVLPNNHYSRNQAQDLCHFSFSLLMRCNSLPVHCLFAYAMALLCSHLMRSLKVNEVRKRK